MEVGERGEGDKGTVDFEGLKPSALGGEGWVRSRSEAEAHFFFFNSEPSDASAPKNARFARALTQPSAAKCGRGLFAHQL